METPRTALLEQLTPKELCQTGKRPLFQRTDILALLQVPAKEVGPQIENEIL
jgi:hypothetical protein